MTSQGTDARGAPPVEVEALRKQHPVHPDYGPCDALADGGMCSVCLETLDRLRQAKEEAAEGRDRALERIAVLLTQNTALQRRLAATQQTATAAIEGSEKLIQQLQRRLAALTRGTRDVLAVLEKPEAQGFSVALGQYAHWGAVQLAITMLKALDADAQERG